MIVLSEIVHYLNLGFQPIYLREREKRPLTIKWTKKPPTLNSIESNFKPNYNVGCLLGHKVGEYYLIAIDVDFKEEIPNERAKDEVAKKLVQLSSDIDWSKCTKVITGKRNGSCHYYLLVKEKPKTKHITSKFKDWEISVLSFGAQTVMPPSIHPITGKEYVWAVKPKNKNSFFKVDKINLDITDAEKYLTDILAKADKEAVELSIQNIDIDSFSSGDLPFKIRLMIQKPEQFPAYMHDRSAFLFGLIGKMLRFLNDSQICSILTDPRYEIHKVAVSHTHSEDRKRNFFWVYKYSLVKAKLEFSAAKSFDYIDNGEAAEKFIVKSDAWKNRLERVSGTDGRPKPNLRNLDLILSNLNDVPSGVIGLDQFNQKKVYLNDTPWASKGDTLTDNDFVEIKLWLSHVFRIEPTTQTIIDAVNLAAEKNKFHPIRDYLLRLRWDGQSRIKTWMRDYLNAEAPEPYLSSVSSILIHALIKRVMQPGCKFDHVIILEGTQGSGKSTSLNKLVGDEWFSDSYIQIGSKDAILMAHNAWLHEMGELAGMRKTDANALKSFITVREDHIRPPFGRETIHMKRQCVFVGTTNDMTYLNDPTGNRRFWPVKVSNCKFKDIEKTRDQLFAEGMHYYETLRGQTKLYLNDEVEKQAKSEQLARQFEDIIIDQLKDFFSEQANLPPHDQEINPIRFRITDLFVNSPLSKSPMANMPTTRSNQMRVADSLKLLGFESYKAKGYKYWRPRK